MEDFKTFEIILDVDYEREILTIKDFHFTFILKFSSTCAKSHTIKYEIREWIEQNSAKLSVQLLLLDVKKRPEISSNISEAYSIPHASPQLIVVNRDGSVLDYANQYEAVDLLRKIRV